MKGDCVYFISDGERVKIGFTANLALRLKQLQTGHWARLKVVATIPGATRATERLLHRALQECRLGGEWFACKGGGLRVLLAAQGGKHLLTKADIEYAATVPAAAFSGAFGAKEHAKMPPTRLPDKVQIKKGVPAPVPAEFVGTALAARIGELNTKRYDKSLTQQELGRVYRELRQLANGRVLTAG